MFRKKTHVRVINGCVIYKDPDTADVYPFRSNLLLLLNTRCLIFNCLNDTSTKKPIIPFKTAYSEMNNI